MDVPPRISEHVFEHSFVRGAVLLAEMRFSSGQQRRKYLVILNHDPRDDDTLVALTTSQADFLKTRPRLPQVHMAAKSVAFFPLETIIDCRTVYPVLRADLQRQFRDGTLAFAGHLPTEILEQVEKALLNSPTVSLRHKQLIFGWSKPTVSG